MDWYLDGSDVERVGELRREFREYLRRHASRDQDDELGAAELTFAELVNNAVEHGGGSVWVSVDWSGVTPQLTIADLGHGFSLQDISEADPRDIRGRGLAIAASLASHLDVRARASGGTRVVADLPVRRVMATSLDPPRLAFGRLLDVSEATPTGFDRSAFLRALVVGLAQEAERREGPDVAEALVAQVGIDVGAEMEQEYRATHEITGPLTAAQLADCYVRLKHAIEGDFYILEVTDSRIVLGNRQCPFGDAVRRAPALCRMTSSVFGGIAAQNGPGATVVLEERIAVGDHQCRVIVDLGRPSDSGEHLGHRYWPPEHDAG